MLTAVSGIISELNKFKSLIKSDFYEKHKSAEDIAEYYHLDLPLTWAILLKGKEDLAECKNGKFAENAPDPLRFADVWSLSKTAFLPK